MNKINWSLVLANWFDSITRWFISAAFIMWGWNIIAPHINCPIFTYWEIFAMRMGLSYIVQMFVKNIALNKEKEEE